MDANLIKMIMANRLPKNIARAITSLYKKRIFVDNLDAEGNTLLSDMKETGVLKNVTSVEEDGVITMDYSLFIEKKKDKDIFSFSDNEIKEIEKLLADEIGNEVKIKSTRWKI